MGDGRVEGRVLDAVPVDLADVEVFFHFGHAGRGDAVCGAPDARWGARVLVREGFPYSAVDEGRHSAGCFGGAAVVLTGFVEDLVRIKSPEEYCPIIWIGSRLGGLSFT